MPRGLDEKHAARWRVPRAVGACLLCLCVCLGVHVAQAQGRGGGIHLGNLFGGMGGGGGQACVFKCPGGVAPRPREGHTPVYNGCGVPGFMVETKYGMTEVPRLT
jgi:hypothetical protein